MVEVDKASHKYVIGPPDQNLKLLKLADSWWDYDRFSRVQKFSKFSNFSKNLRGCASQHLGRDWLILGGMVMNDNKGRVKVARLRLPTSGAGLADSG